MKLFDLIAEQHRDLNACVSCLRSDRDAHERRMRVIELGEKAEAHMRTEERFVYPLMIRLSEGSNWCSESVTEHAAIRLHFRELNCLPSDPIRWEAHLDDVCRLIQEHNLIEDKIIFPRLQAVVLESECEVEPEHLYSSTQN